MHYIVYTSSNNIHTTRFSACNSNPETLSKSSSDLQLSPEKFLHQKPEMITRNALPNCYFKMNSCINL
jgi:hypothetical protein